MEELKKEWNSLKSLIDSCGAAGVNGARVADLKSQSEKVNTELANLDGWADSADEEEKEN